MALTHTQIDNIVTQDGHKRLSYFQNKVKETQELWILVDDFGCMMMTSEDEDLVPVWSDQELAQLWAIDDWKDSRAQAIPVKTWRQRWTVGLGEDGISVAVFPVENDQGIILYPDEFEDILFST